MIPLKYNTAGQEIPLGYFLDSTDGDTEETALTINNTDIKLCKNGATSLVNKNSGGATHMSNGVYYAVLDATDTNTYGPLKIYVHVAGALAVVLECVVMNADAYDALYAANGTGNIETNVVEISGDSGAADNLESDYDGTGYNKSNSTIANVTNTVDANLVEANGVATSLDGTDFDNYLKKYTIIPELHLPSAVDLADSVGFVLGISLKTNRGALPTESEITPGTISILRKPLGGTSWISVVAGAACSETDGRISFIEVFNSGAGYLPNDSIRVLFGGQAVVIDGITYEINRAAGGMEGYFYIREAMRGTDSAATPGDQMNLVDNAITANKFDEATAYPVTNPDSGSTEIARTGADSDTLETISDQIDTRAPANEYDTEMARIDTTISSRSSHTAADIWSVATRTLTSFGTLTTDTASAVWNFVVENSKTALQFLRIIKASEAGKSSGGGTNTVVFQDDADTKARITATVDASGNRTSVTLDGS
jgi:hypothetical protein